jgi:short-subunit dehydrogenase
MKIDILRGKWALVTGASSGLGVEFARELAASGCNLVLTARRADRLAQLQAELIERFGISAKTMPIDLFDPMEPQALYDQTKAAGIAIDVLVNNAGFGLYGKFLDVDWQREQELLQINMTALAHLTRLFVPDMVSRKFGFILNVASNGAYQATPLYAIYSASKSFVLHFSEALNYELRGTKVKCTALSPATVLTEFHQIAGKSGDNLYVRLTQMPAATVAHIGIKAMLKGRPSVVPGWKIALLAWASQRAPRSWSTAVTGWLMRL